MTQKLAFTLDGLLLDTHWEEFRETFSGVGSPIGTDDVLRLFWVFAARSFLSTFSDWLTTSGLLFWEEYCGVS